MQRHDVVGGINNLLDGGGELAERYALLGFAVISIIDRGYALSPMA